ncbi:MAG: D-glycero-beta-D-manno-heptose-7-phosphate kinase [Desulfobacterales bacterium]|nr:D-glycero-beta-D-manno-heptose-7-phosphate kinase [Desulfobacterales bacterium]
MEHRIDHFPDCRLLVVGDLMIDEYVWGDVNRISPEAPVQVVTVEREELTLGGAGNVVNNLVALGARAAVVGVAGNGPEGRRMLDMFARLQADCSGIVREDERPTTRKTRIIASNQHVLRIDRESRRDIAPDTCERLKVFIEAEMPQVDGVLVSDYDKGLITTALMARITAAARAHGKFVIVDPKTADFSRYRGATLLTPNRKEASRAAGIDITDEATLVEAARRIMQTAALEKLLITMGADGMVFFENGQPPYRIDTRARQVYDVSGAGDTVLSVLGLVLAAGGSLKDAMVMANTAAGMVVGKVGTATIGPVELKSALATSGQRFPSKHRSIEALPALLTDLRRRNQRVVLTNGCFDLIHVGHIQLVSAARDLGDFLIVAIDDDESVRQVKGPGRPVIAADERIRILSALDSVDAVVVFASEALEDLIDLVKPDVLAKGSNYQSAEVRGHDRVTKHGGRVALVPIAEDVSAAQIINNIRNGK